MKVAWSPHFPLYIMITVTLIIAMVKVKSNENEIMKLMHFYITQMQRAVDASNINNHTNYAPPVRQL